MIFSDYRHDNHHQHHEQPVLVWEGVNSARLAIFYHQQSQDSRLLGETMTIFIVTTLITILLVLRLETITIVIVKFLWEIGMCYHKRTNPEKMQRNHVIMIAIVF